MRVFILIAVTTWVATNSFGKPTVCDAQLFRRQVGTARAAFSRLFQPRMSYPTAAGRDLAASFAKDTARIRFLEFHATKPSPSPTQKGLFIDASLSPQTIDRFARNHETGSVAFMFTEGWFGEGAGAHAPFHGMIRIGSYVYHLREDGQILKEPYRDVMDYLFHNRPKAVTHEMVFSLGRSNEKSLQSYFEDRLHGEARFEGETFKTLYDVGAIEFQDYEKLSSGTRIKRENCVTFILSCLEPDWHEAYPNLLAFKVAAGLAQSPNKTGDSVLHAVQYLTIAARSDAVITWRQRTDADPSGEDVSQSFFNRLAKNRGIVMQPISQ